MTTTEPDAPPARQDANAVVRNLSVLDRFLPLWIIAAMALGLGLGRAVPGLNDALSKVSLGGTSLPIAIGLLVMMYPVLAKVRYDRGSLGHVTGDRRLMVTPLVLNWIVGPALMFALAWILLPDLPAYRDGLIIVGLARCIAMVIIWNDLACGDREATAVLVALNSVFQVIAFGLLGWFYLELLPGWLGPGRGQHLRISGGTIAVNVLIYLGIPLVAGFATRRLGEKRLGRDRYESRVLPRLGPWALYGLLFTIVILFALQGKTITSRPGDVARIALPLLCYFAIMWFGSFAIGKRIGLPYRRTATLAFTAAGNNFELAIAVAIATFGVTSGQALSGVVGPLIEVPVLPAQLRIQGARDGAPVTLHADMVLVVTGVRPETRLAASAGATLGARGAISVDRTMRTGLPGVYAAGDCVITHHRLLGETYLPLGTTAHKQGRVAGENAAGRHREFAGSLGTQVVKIFDHAVARTGLRDHEARAAGYDPVTIGSEADDHKAYYPGSHKIAMRFTGDRATGRLLGVQLFGHRHAEIAKRIDIAAVSIFHGMTVDHVSDLDLSYTPPLGSPWDAVQMGAQAWTRQELPGEPPAERTAAAALGDGALPGQRPRRRQYAVPPAMIYAGSR